MAFDPSTSADAMEQGFTTCEIEDLPVGLPSRSLADNLYQSEDFPTAEMRTRAFAGLSIADRVVAYPEVQFGNKAGSSDARDVGVVDVGDYTDGGLGKFGKGPENSMGADPHTNPIDKR
jgi:hypothetical protein